MKLITLYFQNYLCLSAFGLPPPISWPRNLMEKKDIKASSVRCIGNVRGRYARRRHLGGPTHLSMQITTLAMAYYPCVSEIV